MSKSVVVGLGLALCLGFGGGYVARGSLHPGSGGGAPGVTASIRPAQEFVSVLTFCSHLAGFSAIERDLRRGRSSDAAKRLKDLSNSIFGDANLFLAANDVATAGALRAQAAQMTKITTLNELSQTRGTLANTCHDLRKAYPAPSK